ncbi:hypothetical protein CHUAL_011413 [Chamberlinius hualienensis]
MSSAAADGALNSPWEMSTTTDSMTIVMQFTTRRVYVDVYITAIYISRSVASTRRHESTARRCSYFSSNAHESPPSKLTAAAVAPADHKI